MTSGPGTIVIWRCQAVGGEFETHFTRPRPIGAPMRMWGVGGSASTPRTGTEPKLHVKASEVRRFEPRSVDYLGMESPMNRGCCQFFLKVDWQTCIID